MKFSKPILSLLLSSALWVPAAVAQQQEETTSQQSTTGTPSTPSAVQPQPVVPPVDSATSTSATAATSVDMSAWTGKTVKGSDGKKLGTVSAASGDKVTIDTKSGNVELASVLIAADETGELKASTTSSLDVRAMAKSQQGDMAGAAAVSKRHFAKKAKAAPPAEETVGSQQTPTEQTPAGEAPMGGPEQAPTEQNPQQPPASADQPPANKPPAEQQQTPATPQTPQQ